MDILRALAVSGLSLEAILKGPGPTTMTSPPEELWPRWPRRLHSIAGVLPLMSFVVLHLWINARAMQGQAAYDRVVQKLQSAPGLGVLELFGIFLPLLYHGGYGLWVMRDPARRAPRSPFEPAWVPPLQRATGAVTLLFLSYHLAEIRLAVATSALRPADFHPALIQMLSSTGSLGVPVLAVVYLVGLAAVSYHLAVGLPAFCFTFRLARTQSAHRTASLAGSLLGALCFLLGARTIVYFAAGSPLP